MQGTRLVPRAVVLARLSGNLGWVSPKTRSSVSLGGPTGLPSGHLRTSLQALACVVFSCLIRGQHSDDDERERRVSPRLLQTRISLKCPQALLSEAWRCHTPGRLTRLRQE